MLRFKRDDGTSYPEWEKTLLGNVCNINPKTNELDDMFFYIDLESIESGKLILKEPINKAEAPSRAQRVLEIGDVLFQTVRPYQMNHYYYENKLPMQVVASTGFAQMRLINGDNRFLYYLFYTNDFNKSVDVKCTGSNYPAINSSELAKIKVKIPCLEEQQKIADFLSEVDNIIAMSEKEIESLEMQKKGAMQKIFSQEVRFKADDGSEYPAWEEKKMDNICSFFSGGTPTSSNADYYGGEIPFIRSGEIHLTSTELFITDIGLKASSAKMVNIGDILYALYGATSGEVDISKINGAINQAILCIRPDKYQSSIFIKELLNHNKDKIVKTFLQGGQGNLSAYTIKNLKYEFPCFEEQQKIADFLSEFDNAIEYAKEELEVWKNIKKGLLQQMFE